MAKVRLDILLHNRGMATSREKARAFILAGEVKVNGLRVDKPGSSIDENADIELLSAPKYVSRGGLKLEKAIAEFQVDFLGRTVLDVGASTGGYTDCALKNGADKVYALDVGYGQLDWSLRTNPRVVTLERRNIRYFGIEELGEAVDIITVDVSFISTVLVFPVLKNLIKDDGTILSLIKPQFEVGKDKVGKKGVVREPELHCQVLLNCITCAQKLGLNCIGITYSPITGPQGNIEYFIQLKIKAGSLEKLEDAIAQVVSEAHRQLGGKK
ncbi:MAG: TlyA family RNA methyltransferase [Syntrophomonadaceae bacterium]|nr:TlyA family RNA methyltransferase [Syntrophomonadaceae bacterium]MDD3023264.1 TlyA family RNA methyltransferase [Syntrophomonadaceae bacterium]